MSRSQHDGVIKVTENWSKNDYRKRNQSFVNQKRFLYYYIQNAS